MQKPLEDLLDRMARYEPGGGPVLSLYLRLEPDERGRPRFERFLRKEAKRRGRTFDPRSEARAGYDEDVRRIRDYLASERDPEAGAAILFACHADGLFEAIQTPAAIDGHHFYVGDRPELFHLARLSARHPRCAAVVADTNAARILVFARGEPVDREVVESEKTSRTTGGGWSQMRYQRHTENVRLNHMREIIEQLERVVKRDDVDSIILAGDDQSVAYLRKDLPPHLEGRVKDDLRLDFLASDREVLARTMEAVRASDAEDDEAAVDRLFEAYHGEGLGVVGVEDTAEALERGQVDELLISSNIEELAADVAEPDDDEDDLADATDAQTVRVRLAADLVAQARRTGAGIRFVEDPGLLEAVEGIGATLRYRG